ncbi:putative ATPase [Sterolibacterium denitrificans]|uniref:ATPase n=1 Tax=Sterolibacterium denitrificans TaxID=157592 RepID=A0A7Z7HNV1_9PROT|nr:helicase HerA-like domain-containing protein [Sterolibacterium denitrificans]SMB20996.1 putative ATPase [Sterolibacterium denitrificans]
MTEPLYIAKSVDSDDYPALLPQMANRHGLITGATGTGKTVTLQSLAERLSYAGVPVFMADVKGDLSGVAAAGTLTPKLEKRIQELGLEGYTPFANPAMFWDVFGTSGIPVRATISDMGPLLLARLLNLNETQSGVLQLVFRIADDQGLLLLDLKDLRAMVQYVGDNAKNFTTEYGNVSTASIGAIQRGLLTLEEQGGNLFFGEPMLDIHDLMQIDGNGRGVVNVLRAEKLINAPALYSTFLLWLLAELFEQLPEAGDLDKPRLVFFFDEAHLLFSDAPQALVDKVEQVVRLIRSKGVGVYFVTQNPLDVPEKVLGQLGNRVQHALRAFTPRDQKAVQAAAQTMRVNPKFDAAAVIGELGVGEALVSFLDEKGRPGITERALIFPPASRLGPLTEDELQAELANAPLHGKYAATTDRVSAYEALKGQAPQDAADTAAAPTKPGRPGAIPPPTQPAGRAPSFPTARPETSGGQAARNSTARTTSAAQTGTGGLGGIGDMLGSILTGTTGPRGGRREGVIEAAAKSAARGAAGTVGRELGRQILRGVLGSILGGKR